MNNVLYTVKSIDSIFDEYYNNRIQIYKLWNTSNIKDLQSQIFTKFIQIDNSCKCNAFLNTNTYQLQDKTSN